MTLSRALARPALALDYPMSLAVYDSYPLAQRAVDYLSRQEFPVQSLEIVGTDLKSVERVTGRLTRRKLALAGAISGLWLGLFVGLAFTLFTTHAQPGFVIATPLLGAGFGLVWSQLSYAAATRGRTRDFTSVSHVVAASYEVLVEHNLAAQARELLSRMPPR
jgi:hypothetical protein